MKLKTGRIRQQIFWFSIGIILFVLFTCGLVTRFLIDNFYVLEKKTSMSDAYTAIEESLANETLYNGEFDPQLERLSSNKGLSVLVVTADGTVLFSTARDADREVKKLYHSILNPSDNQSIQVEETEDYVITKEIDTRLNESYLVLWGVLSDGNHVMIRAAVESIHESTKIVQRFLIYLCIFAMFVGAFLSAFITRRITKPVIELNNISNRMSNLDFDTKYNPRKHPNEIDELGNNFNLMSMKLESTIAQLKDQVEKLEAEEQSRKEFVTDVSHELKTPISLIQGYAEGLAEGIMDDEESRAFYLEVIQDEADHMNRIVRQLLDLSRAESTVSKAELTEFDICDIIAAIIDNNRITIEQNDISVNIPQGPIMVYSDEFMIEQVLTNFISNSIHHVSGDKKIVVSVDVTENDTRVSVFNTGNNIPESELVHLWDKFYKVDKARSREYGGSGIGLSIVKATIEKLSGTYGVSNKSDGVEFYFSIPNNQQNA